VSRNVDLIAVAFLLLAIAAYAYTRNLVIFLINSHGMAFGHEVHAIVVPAPPPPPVPLPHIRIMRD
jgi:hypothetical protein